MNTERMQVEVWGIQTTWALDTKVRRILRENYHDLRGVSAFDFFVRYYNDSFGLNPECFVSLEDFLYRPRDYLQSEVQHRRIMNSFHANAASLRNDLLQSARVMRQQGILTLGDWACRPYEVCIDNISRDMLSRAFVNAIQNKSYQSDSKLKWITHSCFFQQLLGVLGDTMRFTHMVSQLMHLPRRGASSRRGSVLKSVGKIVKFNTLSVISCNATGLSRRTIDFGTLYVPKSFFPLVDAFFFVKERMRKHTIVLLKIVTDLTPRPNCVNALTLKAFWERMDNEFLGWEYVVPNVHCEIIYIHSFPDTLLSQRVEVEYPQSFTTGILRENIITFFDNIYQYQVLLESDRITDDSGGNITFPFCVESLFYGLSSFGNSFSRITIH